jgi:SM-20-related protein
MLDLAAFAAMPLAHDPYEHVIVPGFIRAEHLAAIHADFPKIEQPGSFPTADLDYGSRFAALIDALEAPAFRAAAAEKFAIDLAGRPCMITVRGRTRASDGKIHTDTASKLITVLLYLNPEWEAPGGRLRVLRGPDNLQDCAAEVPPVAGTLLAFRRSEKSWHGHEPFEGERRTIQLNWVTDQATVDRELRRHRLSAQAKRLARRLNPFAA